MNLIKKRNYMTLINENKIDKLGKEILLKIESIKENEKIKNDLIL